MWLCSFKLKCESLLKFFKTEISNNILDYYNIEVNVENNNSEIRWGLGRKSV